MKDVQTKGFVMSRAPQDDGIAITTTRNYGVGMDTPEAWKTGPDEYHLTFGGDDDDDLQQDKVTAAETRHLAKLGFAAPTTPATRRRWLDALFVGRLLRMAEWEEAVELDVDEITVGEYYNPSTALDAFLFNHLPATGYTELGEAVMAVVMAVRPVDLRLQSYDVEVQRPYAEQVRSLIANWYVSVYMPAHAYYRRASGPFTTARHEGAPSGGQDGNEREAESGNEEEGPARQA
jgi:hypothetical protein